MASMPEEDSPNYAVFRDCLSTTLLRAQATDQTAGSKKRRRARPTRTGNGAARATQGRPQTLSPDPPSPDPQQDAEELADFIDYLAGSIFDALPDGLREADYRSWRESEELQAQFALPLTRESLAVLDLPPPIPETLVTYGLVAADATADSPLPPSPEAFLAPILTAYLESATTPPPATQATRTDACELCGRSWIPLSYHHLIPRFVHEKAVKRGWHRKEDLQNVAWLCGACHRFVHHFRGHEDLARDYYTVERLLAEDEVRRFAAWAGTLRWKGGKVRGR
ncbi:HNH endonuclease [Purpureocillium lavendulum]|uniref:HNH endonuclease n=1 Tax=Purpureocillium lavendulum TaxID=1247861 RepID=A0AB34FQZ0_9HYPO|nr:HNH endonuclease [Purpureocillium lavendulum]